MPRQKRKKYTREFKEEAVRLLEQDERSGDEIAKALGVDRGILYRWRRELGLKPAPVARVSGALSPDEREELRRLRKEVAQLRVDKEILKKAAAFFAKESK
jgi:transposase